MTSSARSSTLVNEFLNEMEGTAPMMERKLRSCLYWKGENSRQKQPRQQPQLSAPQLQPSSQPDCEISEALKRKDRTRQERSGNRRRVRGGALASVAPSKPAPAAVDSKTE